MGDFDGLVTELRRALSLPGVHPQARSILLRDLGFILLVRFVRYTSKTRSTVDVDESIRIYREALALERDLQSRFDILLCLSKVLFSRSSAIPDDSRSLEESLYLTRIAVAELPAGDPRLAEALDSAVPLVAILSKREIDSAEVWKLQATCEQAVNQALDRAQNKADIMMGYFKILSWLPETHVDRLDEDIAITERLISLAPADYTGIEDVHHAASGMYYLRYKRRRQRDDLDRTIIECRKAMELGHLNQQGLLERLTVALRELSVSTLTMQDLDHKIKLFRRVLQYGASRAIRGAAIDCLSSLLVHRFRWEGDTSDLNEAVALYETSLESWEGIGSVPGVVAAQEAYELQAELYGSSAHAAVALELRLRSRVEDDGDNQGLWKSLTGESYTIIAVKRSDGEHIDHELADEIEEAIARLRAQPDLIRRIDLLEYLVDALQGLMIARPASWVLNELIEHLKMLIKAIPDTEEFHLNSHRLTLGRSLYERAQSGRSGVNDLTDSVGILEHIFHSEIMPTKMRIMSSRLQGEVAARAGNWDVASAGYQVAVGQLARLVPRNLSHADHVRQLADFFGMVSDGAAASIRAGNLENALEMLEQGRGLLIGLALDFRDTSQIQVLSRIAAELAEDVDPHALTDPGHASPADRRRDLVADWNRELANVRKLEGYEDYLTPPRFSEDLLPAARNGPIVTVNVSAHGCHAIVLTAEGVDAVPLLGLTVDGVREQVAKFFRSLPFAELSPDDEAVSVEAQEPLRDVLGWLWDVLVRPVLDRLGRPDRIWWVPTGLLAALPLHAAGRGNECALDRVVSSYAPTIRLLRSNLSAAAQYEDSVAVVAVEEVQGLPPLPGTVAEASNIALRFPDAQLIQGVAATPEAVREVVCTTGWLHLGCHAISIADDPAESALHLHGGEITVREILRTRANSGQLAYLSACSTVLPSTKHADEVIHLGSALQVAGFRHVVGTLWRIPDGTAVHTARLFYEQVTSVDRVPQTLNKTARKLRDEYPMLPTRWASYIHIGI